MRQQYQVFIGLSWLLLSLMACGQDTGQLPSQNNSIKGLISSVADDRDYYAYAIKARQFEFPQDHFPHPEFKTEWWYLTGNLFVQSEDEKEPIEQTSPQFGYQLTLFRYRLKANNKFELDEQEPSLWRTDQVYLIHLALSDIKAKKSYHYQSFSRGALGLAGVWPEENSGRFQLRFNQLTLESKSKKRFLPLKLDLKSSDFHLELELNSAKPLILQGNKGLSQKSAVVGNASYYYSFTRMPSQGQLRLADSSIKLKGLSWFDREFSSSSLDKNQLGWDWFALHLNNETDLMLYQLRTQENGTIVKDSYSYAVLVDKKGHAKRFKAEQFKLEPKKWWASKSTAISYPIEWHLTIPSANLSLQVEAAFAEQEWQDSFKYWEGSVKVSNLNIPNEKQTYGYLEMTGYDK